MSYVPPHLRNSTTTKTTTSTTLEPSTTQYQSFNSHSSQLHQFKTAAAATANGSSRNNNSNSNSNNSASVFSNAARRSSVNLVPDPVLSQWKPSERVLALTPEQVRLTSHRCFQLPFSSL